MDFPEVVGSAALGYKSHVVTYYVQELARQFHGYYNLGNKNPELRVLVEDRSVSEARLFLCMAVGTVLKIALGILGVSAPEKM